MNPLSTFIVVLAYSLVGAQSQPQLDSTGCWNGASVYSQTSTSGAACQQPFCQTPTIDIQSNEPCPPGSSAGVTSASIGGGGLSTDLTNQCGVCPAGYFIANITQCTTGFDSGLTVATCPSSGSSLCSICPNALTSYPYNSSVPDICPSSSTPGVISSSCACAPGQQVAFQSQNMRQICNNYNLDPFSCWMFYGSTYEAAYPGAFYPICEPCPPNTYQSLGSLNPCIACPTGCTLNSDQTDCECQTGTEHPQVMCHSVGPFDAGCHQYNLLQSTPGNTIALTFSESPSCNPK